jgi:hypothetical protein
MHTSPMSSTRAGAMRHNDQIVLPCAVSDTFSRFATIKIAALLQSPER